MQHTTARAWVRQPSGRHLDLVNPSPNDWEDSDLAIGLSRTFRWGGHSIWPNPMSVAQHSLLVLELRRRASATPLDRIVALRELLHDAEEGLLGFDPISPLKPVLNGPFTDLLDRLTHAVFSRYGIPWWTPDEKKKHKAVDQLAAASEAIHVAGWARSELQEVLRITVEPLDEDPLVAIYGGTAWEPWPINVAAERFQEALKELSTRIQD